MKILTFLFLWIGISSAQSPQTGGIPFSLNGAYSLTATLTGNTTVTFPTSGTLLSGTVGIANGGSGKTTANAALNAFLPSQASNSGTYLKTDGTNTSWASAGGGTNAGHQSNPSDPSATNSASGVMLGLAGTITPTNTGKVIIFVSGDLFIPSSGAGQFDLRYGTGTAPAHGAANTGTRISGYVSFTGNSGGYTKLPFSIQGIATGLTTSTAYWIDIDFANTSGSPTMGDITISAHEY